MSYDVAGLGLGGDKSQKKRTYVIAGVAVAVLAVVMVLIWAFTDIL